LPVCFCAMACTNILKGEYPQGPVLDDNGNLYGLTAGGDAGAGVVFKLTP